MQKCLYLHLNSVKQSEYIREIRAISDEIGVPFHEMTKLGACIEGLEKWAISSIVKNVSSKSSLTFCSLPIKWWKKASYVTDTETSKILSEFRGGNARLGNRDSDLAEFAPISLEGRTVICPICSSGLLSESHLVVDCEMLAEARRDCFVNDKNILEIFNEIRRKKKLQISLSDEVLLEFLNTDKDSAGVIRQKAEVLDFLRCQYLSICMS